jgi:hypothetical protein
VEEQKKKILTRVKNEIAHSLRNGCPDAVNKTKNMVADLNCIKHLNINENCGLYAILICRHQYLLRHAQWPNTIAGFWFYDDPKLRK